MFFVSKGIDYKYDILLNDNTIYSYEEMYKGVELDITDILTGENDILTVHIYPHPKRIGALTKGHAKKRIKAVTPPVCYGWDWNPRLLISGIWQDTYIETRDAHYIGHCEVLARLNDEMTQGTVSFDFECEKACDISLYDEDGNMVYHGTNTQITVDAPNLWWCNGQGEPYLYL